MHGINATQASKIEDLITRAEDNKDRYRRDHTAQEKTINQQKDDIQQLQDYIQALHDAAETEQHENDTALGSARRQGEQSDEKIAQLKQQIAEMKTRDHTQPQGWLEGWLEYLGLTNTS